MKNNKLKYLISFLVLNLPLPVFAVGPIDNPIELRYYFFSSIFIIIVIFLAVWLKYFNEIKLIADKKFIFKFVLFSALSFVSSIVFWYLIMIIQEIIFISDFYITGNPLFIAGLASIVSAKIIYKIKIKESVKPAVVFFILSLLLVILNIVIFDKIIEPNFKYCPETIICSR